MLQSLSARAWRARQAAGLVTSFNAAQDVRAELAFISLQLMPKRSAKANQRANHQMEQLLWPS